MEIVRSGFVEGHHRGSVVALERERFDGVVPGRCRVADLSALVQQADPGARHAAQRARSSTATCSRWPVPVTRVSRSTSTEYAGSWRWPDIDEVGAADAADFPLDDAAKEVVHPGGLDQAADRDELLGQARRDARHVRRSTAGHWRPIAIPSIPCSRSPWPPPSLSRPASRSRRSAVDGCGAPLFSASLTGLARAFARLVQAAPGTPERAIVDAFAAYPQFASGTTRDEAALLRAIPGAIGKAGAEACYAVALPDGRAVAMKIDDGYPRARAVVMAAALRKLASHGDTRRRSRRGRSHRKSRRFSAAASPSANSARSSDASYAHWHDAQPTTLRIGRFGGP